MTIKNDGGQSVLMLDVLGQEDSEGWLSANVKFDYKNFSANFRISLMLNDFYPFRDELVKLNDSLTGKANFKTIEDNVDITLIGNGLGHIQIIGMLRHDPVYELALQFDLLSDQTFLAGLLKECDKIIDHHQVH